MNLLLMGRRRGSRWSYLEDNFIREDGDLGVIPGTSYAWDADSWAISSNKAVVTPTLGDELVSNPGMEAGNPPTSWAQKGTPTTFEQSSEQKVSGDYSLKFIADAASEGATSPAYTTITGTWYQASIYARPTTSAVNERLYYQRGSDGVGIDNKVKLCGANTWTQMVASWLELAGGAAANVALSSTATSQTAYLDDASVKPLTFASLIALVDIGLSSVNVQCSPTIEDKLPAGVLINWNAAKTSGVLGLHLGPTARLYKCVTGTWTQLIDTVATYSAGKPLRVVRTATTTYQLWYNGVQVGTNQTISDAEIVDNTYHGLFGTHANSTPGTFRVERA